MKKQICLLALIGVLLLSAAPAWAQGDFFVIAGGGPPVGTKITYLPYEIKQPGFYYFAGNLSCNSGINDCAILISVDNVTLDLMGYSLSGPGGSTSLDGIGIGGVNNVRIRNGTVSGFHLGVTSGMGNNNWVSNIRAINNGVGGIDLGGTNLVIKNCTAGNNCLAGDEGFGGLFVGSGEISGCVAYNNYVGIAVNGPGNVLGNAAFSNSVHNFFFGVEFGEATAILVDRNSAFGKNPNYYVESGTTGVQWGTNAGTP